MNLILYKGNNYYNRRIVRAINQEEYELELGFTPLAAVESLAFIQNDGITTSQIINYDHESYGFGDYAIVYNTSQDIDSRWWVVKSTVIRNGQVRLDLLRDVIADWYDEIMTAPTFIKKGFPQSINDPAIFNNEDMSYNQIKQNEYFIKDETQCGWYVGYIPKKTKLGDTNISVPGYGVAVSNTYDTLEEYEYSQYTSSNPYIGDYTDIIHNIYVYVQNDFSGTTLYCAGFDDGGARKNPNVSGYKTQIWTPDGVVVRDVNQSSSPRGFRTLSGFLWGDDFWSQASTIGNWKKLSYSVTGAHTETDTNNFFNSQNDRVISVGGVTKRVKISQTTITRTVDAENGSGYGQNAFKLAAQTNLSTTEFSGKVASITFSATAYYVSYEDVTVKDSSYKIPADRTPTADVPYDVFAIPAGPIRAFGEPYYSIPSNPDLSKRLASAIANTLVSGQDAELYDIQYLPYCPLADEFLYPGVIDNNSLNKGATIDVDFMTIADTPNNWTMVIYASQSSFTKKIDDYKIYTKNDVEGFKVDNECDIYRLCSPNYNGQFEFSATKNGGVKAWNISFTCKPFTPYIRIAPDFGRLYGKDFGDARGLICGGDFSISQTNDAWRSYELNNKNYQVMFDRQIQNMEVNNSIQRGLDITNAVVGTAGGGASGFMIGNVAGKGPLVGGITAGVSAAAGIADIFLNERMRAEQMDYTKDQFGYQLQNIQALPYSLTKVGSQNTDYKVWPFVEKYTCSEIEKEALRSKLRWNGYTIERIGTIENFLNPNVEDTFIQGKLIRLELPERDSHIVDVINTELQTGVYIT